MRKTRYEIAPSRYGYWVLAPSGEPLALGTFPTREAAETWAREHLASSTFVSAVETHSKPYEIVQNRHGWWVHAPSGELLMLRSFSTRAEAEAWAERNVTATGVSRVARNPRVRGMDREARAFMDLLDDASTLSEADADLLEQLGYDPDTSVVVAVADRAATVNGEQFIDRAWQERLSVKTRPGPKGPMRPRWSDAMATFRGERMGATEAVAAWLEEHGYEEVEDLADTVLLPTRADRRRSETVDKRVFALQEDR